MHTSMFDQMTHLSSSPWTSHLYQAPWTVTTFYLGDIL